MVQQLETIAHSESPRCYIPKRYILAFLGFFGQCNLYAMRMVLSVAMVAMVNNTESAIISNETTRRVECPMLQEQEEKTSEVTFKGEQYNWDPKKQGLLLGAFFYGYTITQIPGGYMAAKFGAKWMFGGPVFTTSILTLLAPLSAKIDEYVFMTVRILEGIGEGVAYPAITLLVSRWSPVLERSRISTLIYIGSTTGYVLTMPLTGWLSSSDLFGGWPSSFYFFGVTGCTWFVFWAFLVHESPSVHPTISKEELGYILQNNDNGSEEKSPVPWKSILTSMPVWATLVAHFGHDIGLNLYLIELPTYLNSILHFNLTKDGLFSALPFVMEVLAACFVSYAADKLRASGRMSITWIRKLMNSIGFIGSALCLLCVTVAGCRSELIVGLFILGKAMNGFMYSGFIVTHVDMSPQFSGILFGLTNTFGNLCGVIVPAIVGAVTADGATIPNWNKVFYIVSAVYITSAIFFFVFASAEEQSWGRDSKQKEENELATREKPVAIQNGA